MLKDCYENINEVFVCLQISSIICDTGHIKSLIEEDILSGSYYTPGKVKMVYSENGTYLFSLGTYIADINSGLMLELLERGIILPAGNYEVSLILEGGKNKFSLGHRYDIKKIEEIIPVPSDIPMLTAPSYKYLCGGE